MKSYRHLPFFVLIASSFLGCNPDCQNITGVYFANHPYLEEEEVLIQANDPNTLRNRSVYFNDVQADDTRFVADLGLIAKLPPSVSGESVSLRIEDNDCADFITFDLNVQDEGYFVANPEYIPPAPPQIIIPIPNPPIPPNINNAWISPNNTDYCIWFVVDSIPGSNGNFVISPNPLEPGGKKSLELSVEQAPCKLPPRPETNLYHQNPVYGMISTSENHIQFWIDRTSKGLGIEEFEGKFIDIDDTPYNDDRTPECGTWGVTKKHMMMVTSKQTNRSLLLYQQLPE